MSSGFDLGSPRPSCNLLIPSFIDVSEDVGEDASCDHPQDDHTFVPLSSAPPGVIAQDPDTLGRVANVTPDSSMEVKVSDSSTEGGDKDVGLSEHKSHLLDHMSHKSRGLSEYGTEWQTYYIKFQSGAGMYQIELIFSQGIIRSLCLGCLIGASSFLILYSLGAPLVASLFLSAPFSVALFFVCPF